MSKYPTVLPISDQERLQIPDTHPGYEVRLFCDCDSSNCKCRQDSDAEEILEVFDDRPYKSYEAHLDKSIAYFNWAERRDAARARYYASPIPRYSTETAKWGRDVILCLLRDWKEVTGATMLRYRLWRNGKEKYKLPKIPENSQDLIELENNFPHIYAHLTGPVKLSEESTNFGIEYFTAIEPNTHFDVAKDHYRQVCHENNINDDNGQIVDALAYFSLMRNKGSYIDRVSPRDYLYDESERMEYENLI